MRKGWVIKKLGDLVTIKTGKLDANAMVEGGLYPFFTCSREVYSINKYAFDCEAILLAGNNASGDFNVKHYKGKFNAYQRTYVITVSESNRILYKYLNYKLVGHLKKLKEQSVGANTKFLKVGMITDIKVELPPIPEQQRIVALLDEAFEAIEQAKANTERNLQNARELFQSELNRIFTTKGEGWVEKKIGEVCGIMNGGTPDTKVKEFWDGDNLWITPKDMGRLTSIFVDDTERKITDAGIKNSSAKILPPDSVILSSRAPIGHLAINAKPLSTNQGCKGLIPNQNISTLYLYYFLKNSVQLLNDLGSGTTFKELSGSKLSEVIIPLPPLSEQQNIVKQLGSLSAETKRLEANYQKKLDGLEELKKSILQKAFSGELTRETTEIQMEQLDMVAEDQVMYNPNQ